MKKIRKSGVEGYRGRRAVSFKGTYVTTLQAHGVEISITPRGPPWENGYAERLIRPLKEEVDINDYQSITEARDRIGHFTTKGQHHQKCPHSALGYLTPMEFQRKTFS